MNIQGTNKMKKIRHNIAGLVFAVLGVIFLVKDNMHMGNEMHMSHGTTLLGVSEMTWMWFAMAIVHFFLNDCHCKQCKGENNG